MSGLYRAVRARQRMGNSRSILKMDHGDGGINPFSSETYSNFAKLYSQ
jgi:hypothetical protein